MEQCSIPWMRAVLYAAYAPLGYSPSNVGRHHCAYYDARQLRAVGPNMCNKYSFSELRLLSTCT